MARTLSTRSVLKILREAGFPMDAIVEQSRGWIRVRHSVAGRTEFDQHQATLKLTQWASDLLGWGWSSAGYGSANLWADRGCPVHRELVSLNVD